MMTCRDVSTLIASGALRDVPPFRRLGIWMHLAMCRHCLEFRRQMATLVKAAQAVAASFEAELSSTYERTLEDRLSP